MSLDQQVDSIALMGEAWRYEGRTKAARDALDRFKELNPTLQLAGTVDLYDLVVQLDQPVRGSHLAKEDKYPILNAMLKSADDPEIARALVQTLIPGLAGECAKLRWGRGIEGVEQEMMGVAIATCHEVVVDWAGEDRQYAGPDILDATRNRVRRWMFKEKNEQNVTSMEWDWGSAPTMDGDPLLERLKAFEGTEHERIARVAARRVFDKTGWSELAAEEGMARAHLQAEVQDFTQDWLLR